MNRNKDFKRNYFGSLPKVQINAEYKNGQLIDLETEQPIELKEGAVLKIATDSRNLKDEVYEHYNKVEIREILKKGDLINMKIPITYSQDALVKIELGEDLFMVKKMNKLSILKNCHFIARTMELPNGEKVYFDNQLQEGTLNQIFFRISMKYRPDARTHSINIYEHCYDRDWNKLELYRF